MDINRLKEFITLATQLNYSKAANMLFLTQPALSRHIHDLEQSLGVQLFIRDTHKVHLTSIGELFFQEAQEIVSRYDYAVQMIKDVSSLEKGELKIGFLGTAAQSFLSGFVIGFTSSHPQIKLSLYCDGLKNLVSQVSNGTTDLAFVTHADKNYLTGIESEEVYRSHMFAVMHPNNPFAFKESISIEELSGVPFINLSAQSNPITRDFNKALFKTYNTELNEVKEVDNVETGLFCASINEGIFFIPDYLRHIAGSLTVIPIKNEKAYVAYNLIWKKKNSNPSIPVFIDAFHVYLENHPKL